MKRSVWRRDRFVQENPELAGVVHRNIHALMEVRQQVERRKGLEERVADAITTFTGSMPFVYLHALLLGGWIVANLRVIPGIRPWDPYPFVMLAMIASVEAIFLSTFVLISQNRMQELNDQRADLDLHINLLAEHEITRLIQAVDAIARHLGVEEAFDPEAEELKVDVPPEVVLRELEEAEVEAAAEDPDAVPEAAPRAA